MEISFLGTEFQNESDEHIIIAGEISNVLIESEGNSYEFLLEYDDSVNQSDIFFTLNEPIPKGQYFILDLYWEQLISPEFSPTHNISVYWHKQIGISTMKVYIQSYRVSYCEST